MTPPSPGKFVFVHLPKTAGTSLRVMLTNLFTAEKVSPAFAVKPISATEAQSLRQYSVISGHISWDDVQEHFADRQMFTFLRDPVDRCLSVYAFYRQHTHMPLIPLEKIRGDNSPQEAISLARQLPPEEFFAVDHPHVRQNIENRMVWQMGYRARFEDRSTIREEEALRRAIHHLERCVFVGFFANLNQDTERLVRVLGFQQRIDLPSVNRTSTPVRARDLSTQARKQLERINQLDRTLYETALQRFAPMSRAG